MDETTKCFEVPRTSSMVDTGSIFSPLVLDLKADVPKPVGFHFMIVFFWLVCWLVGCLEFKLFLQQLNRVNHIQ